MSALLLVLLATYYFTPTACQSTTALYAQYVGYISVEAQGYSGFWTPTFTDCAAYATANPNWNGVSYNAAIQLCKPMPAANNEILVKLNASAGWTTLVKDISQVFKLVAKSENSQNQAGYQAYDAILTNIASGATAGLVVTTNYTTGVQSFNKSTSCLCNYRNVFLDSWSSMTVGTVKQTLTTGGLDVLVMMFSGNQTTNINWFSKTNMVFTAPWSLQNVIQTVVTMSPQIYNPTTSKRSFGMAVVSTSCATASGFLKYSFGWTCVDDNLVASTTTPQSQFPIYDYSLTNTYSVGANSAGTGASPSRGQAEFASTWVKIFNRTNFV